MKNVNLVGISAFCGDLKDRTPEEAIVYMARVSNPSNQNNFEDSSKLIKYLIQNKHWSPFEMVHVVMEINTTRDITRQILRHRSFSFQEFSQRYANPVEDLQFESREARIQDPKNRQNSHKTENFATKQLWDFAVDKLTKHAKEQYNKAIKAGIAKEQARALLPEGLIQSRLYMNGTLRSWIHYINLRSANGTQLEHMEIAQECGRIIAKVFPFISNLLE